MRFRLKTDDSYETSTLIASSGDFTEGELVYAAATDDGTTMRLYKNGVKVGALDKNGDIVGLGEGIWIGGNPNVATSHPWDGLISDVRVYQQA
ncbi:MAG: LamG-like jellyroll fold domain-containing protein [Methylococcales bacterium]